MGVAVWDTCQGNSGKNSLNGNISVKGTCLKYAWSVNGVLKGTSYNFHYPVTTNGTYVLCVKVTDTCNRCDTTICSTRTISCFGSKCSWSPQKVSFVVWDTCQGNSGANSLNGGISVKGSCLKYAWSVNGVLKSTSYNLHYPVTANGTYVLCVKVTDTCNKCDTTICSTRTVNCFGSRCNWSPQNVSFAVWDTCQGSSGRNSLNGNISVKGSCLKYSWSVNGVVKSDHYSFHYPVTANGTYVLCVKVTDTCNKCDTTFCSTRTISCFGNKCSWGPQNVGFAVWDTCQGSGGRNSLNGNISVKGSCLRYSWSVNGVVKSDHYSFHYPVTANGTYLLCVKVTDTCNKCDTTFCSTRTISCFGSKCNWGPQNVGFALWDTCQGSKGRNSLNGSISSKAPCLKYAWSVNGVLKGHNHMLNYPVTANGIYVLCVKVTDTCNKCDTTFCSTRTVSCFGSRCNWGPQNVGFAVWDTCKGSSGRNSLNGNISVKGSCLKYAWSVNGVVRGNSYNFHYPLTANGTYLLCVKVTDTCNKCDTTFCSTRTISCFKSKCNWGPQNVGFATWDSCQGSVGSSINGSISVKGSCLKYLWSVNGVVKGNSYILHYPITTNGSYLLCVKVTDTCNRCDTTFCKTFNINCRLLSTDHITSAEQLKLYPNPADDVLGLDWSGNDCRYVIISAMGAIMQEGTVTAGNNQLKIAELPEGVYFVQVQAGSGLLIRKLVIHR